MDALQPSAADRFAHRPREHRPQSGSGNHQGNRWMPVVYREAQSDAQQSADAHRGQGVGYPAHDATATAMVLSKSAHAFRAGCHLVL
jgi:hypothetical protein